MKNDFPFRPLVNLVIISVMIFSSCCTKRQEQPASNSEDYLVQGWMTPPQCARPHVWWHWMNGNITQDGIRKDIEWFNRIGIGGFHIFDANFSTPQVVEKRLVYMTEEWKDAFHLAITLADSLGMDVAIPSSPGFSSTGGPWVKPEDAMKKIVWREMMVEGGREIDIRLPEPYSVTGKFQNYGMKKGASVVDSGPVADRHYVDIAVVAARQPASFKTLHEMGAVISSSDGDFTLEQLTNGDFSDGRPLSAGQDGFAWVQYEFSEPQTIRSLSVINDNPRNERHSVPAYCLDSLQISDDGINFRTAFGIPVGDAVHQTISFEPLTARFFRLKHKNPAAAYHYTMKEPDRDPDFSIISEFVLYPDTRINHFEEKAGYASAHDIELNPTPDSEEEFCNQVIDLTSYVKDGRLTWNAPDGRWTIYRIGASLTGKKNHPASPEATGFEVDKLDRAAWERHFRNYLDMNRKAVDGMLGKKGISYLLIDSYEAAHQNWTPTMREEFNRRRGYDPVPWYPVLTGMVIGNIENSERFLWDWRKTIGEMFEENFDVVSRMVKDEYGMKGCFIEAHANGRAFIADGMAMKRSADIPMSEMWIQSNVGTQDRVPEGLSDIRESASVAHIYGRSIVAAESFTCIGVGGQAYTFHPGDIKWTADNEMAMGVNHFVIHDSAHQPSDDLKPGLGLGVYGQWFTRHDTWAEQAGAWIDYLARSSYMLQQGEHVSDVLWYYGEDNNITGLYSHCFPAVPEGYDFDFLNPDALLNAVNADNGKIVTISGKKYQLLHLDENAARMSLDVLKKISSLAREGVFISGQIPVEPASLLDSNEEFNSIVKNIWYSGRKNVYGGSTLAEAISRFNITPDWECNDNQDIRVVHRKLEDGDIYWINSPAPTECDVRMTFRVSGLKPYKWDPVTGKICELSYRMKGDRTILDLTFSPQDAFFIVFREKTQARILHLQSVKETVMQVLAMEGLGCWTENPETKHFSGTLSYKVEANLPEVKGRVILDLGEVHNIAQIYVNGIFVETLWRVPFRSDITEFIKDGKADIEIRVTNSWVNRLIGEALLEESERSTYTTFEFYTGDEKLDPSGLIGPVKLILQD